jgi:hypothetical protein
MLHTIVSCGFAAHLAIVRTLPIRVFFFMSTFKAILDPLLPNKSTSYFWIECLSARWPVCHGLVDFKAKLGIR